MLMSRVQFKKLKANNDQSWYKNRVFYSHNKTFKFKILSADYINDKFEWETVDRVDGKEYNPGEPCDSILDNCFFSDDVDDKIAAIENTLQVMKEIF